MKYLRTLSIASFLAFVLFLNWNCSDDSNYNVNSPNNEVQTDDPGEHVTLIVLEYCLVSPPLTAPYYTYLQILNSKYSEFPPYGYNTGNFTTPDNDRTDGGGTRYQTQHFKIVKSSLWKCETVNCAARYWIGGVLEVNHHFTSGSCNPGLSCPSGTTCGTYYDEDDNINLAENTQYSYFVGADCLVGDEWENE